MMKRRTNRWLGLSVAGLLCAVICRHGGINETMAACNSPDGKEVTLSLKTSSDRLGLLSDSTIFCLNEKVTLKLLVDNDENKGYSKILSTSTASTKPNDQTSDVMTYTEDDVTGDCSTSLTYTVVAVDHIENKGQNISGSETRTYVPVNSNLTFTAIPSTGQSGDWPTEKPLWNDFEASSGSTFTRTFDEPGDYEIIAECGNAVTAKVTVLKVDLSTNLWWFAGENPGGGYDVQATLTVTPVTTGTFKWDVTAGTSIVDLNNGGADSDSITATDDNNVTVKSTGASSSIGDVTVALTYNGNAVCNYNLTVRKPGTPQLLPGYPADNPYMYGYQSTYRFKLLDQFGVVIPYEMPINESFGTWSNDCVVVVGWIDVSPNGTNSVFKEFEDNYGIMLGLVPLSVPPSDPNAGEPVKHSTQYYRAGSTSPGCGVLIKQHTLQLYRGRGRQL